MKSILISIKPTFVEQIRQGKKVYEFRKRIPSDTTVTKMYIYSSYPVKKIVAECDIDFIIKGTPENVWNQTNLGSGISKQYFNDYFKCKEIAYAIKLTNIKFYEKPKNLADFNVKRAPQSYQYIIN